MKKHTPTPWLIDPAGVGNVEFIYRNPKSKDDAMGFSIHPTMQEEASEQDLVDLRFIERAVNCHDELLAALKLAECQHLGCGGRMKPEEVVEAMRAILQAAILKAEQSK